MKFAYADPPYYGFGKKYYGHQHEEASIWDTKEAHYELIKLLCNKYPDGWALSMNMKDLQWQPAIERWAEVLGRQAPQPQHGKGVSADFVEWMMGLPEGYVTDIGLSRQAQLKILGNGVVPQQAALALQLLAEGGYYAKTA